MRSIRRTLLWRLLGGALVLLLAGAAVLYAGAARLLTDQFDETLQTRLSTFVTLIDEEGFYIEIDFDPKSMPEYVEAEELEYFQMWLHDDGQLLFRSPSLGEADLPLLFGSEEDPRIFDVALPDGRAGRAIGAHFTIRQYEPAEDEDPGPAHVVLVLAKGRDTLDGALAALMAGTVVGILLLLGAGAFVGRSAVRRGLHPLEAFARHVGAVDDPRRASDFSVEGLPDELVPLAESHNQMLERIRQAFERERRTTANIAHELRTPVAELMMLTETAQHWGRDADSFARGVGELREIAEQMSGSIATLLELARMESGQVPLEVESIDLAQMLRDCWSSLSASTAARNITFRAPQGSGPHVLADRAALSILLGNLLANAVQHAPAGDVIGCEAGNGTERSYVVLSNSAGGLAQEDLGKLDEPFWRSSASREDRAHAGLGLSLVSRLAALLELELSFHLEQGEFRVELRFPDTGPHTEPVS